MANKSSRMTSAERRAQLIDVGRTLFAAKGFEAVSVEEIASAAKVSKPIVYEHFGGKEGLYAVIVDREMQSLTNALISTLDDPDEHPRQIVEKAALALLTYIEENAEGFQVLVRDSPSTDPTGSFSSLLGDVSTRVEDLLSETFKRHKIPVKGAPYYAQMLVGMTVFTGQYWADRRRVNKEQLAAYIVNLAWNGLSSMDAKPELHFESAAAKNRLRKEAERKEKAERAEREAERKAALHAEHVKKETPATSVPADAARDTSDDADAAADDSAGDAGRGAGGGTNSESEVTEVQAAPRTTAGTSASDILEAPAEDAEASAPAARTTEEV